MKIYLIGMPGSGKSTIGKALASKLKYHFVDTDSYIEKYKGKSIPKIFSEEGEEAFRTYESKSLKALMPLDNLVISCGGGIVLKKENKDYMTGLIVYLDVSLEDLELRVKNDNKNERPISKVKSVTQIYEERKDLYDYFKDISVKSQIVSHTVKQILKEIKKNEKSFSN